MAAKRESEGSPPGMLADICSRLAADDMSPEQASGQPLDFRSDKSWSHPKSGSSWNSLVSDLGSLLSCWQLARQGHVPTASMKMPWLG